MKAKPYASKAYLTLHFRTKGKTIEQIAKENGVSPNTIRSKLKEFDLIK